MAKPVLCLDFDGVVHQYVSGWQGPRVIADPPMDGALEFMQQALMADWDVVIHSSRSAAFGAVQAMRAWLEHHAGEMWEDSGRGPGLRNVRFVRYKPPAMVTIDDRALTFQGVWPNPVELKNFKPWKPKA